MVLLSAAEVMCFDSTLQVSTGREMTRPHIDYTLHHISYTIAGSGSGGLCRTVVLVTWFLVFVLID